jgi:hypothetical protein
MEFSFAANQTLDTLEGVPDSFQGAYEKNGEGKFVVKADVLALTTAFDGVSTALTKERGVTKTLRTQKDAAAQVKEVLGFDTLEAAKTKFDELTTQVASKANVDPAKIRSEIEATFQTEREGFKTELSAMESTLSSHLVGNVAKSALSAHKGNELFLMPHIEKAAKVVKDDTTGDYVVRVVDGDGQYRGDGKGGFMGVDDLVVELKKNKAFAGAFESEANGGGHRQNGQPAPRGAQQQQRQRQEREGRSSTDKIASGIANLERGGFTGES